MNGRTPITAIKAGLPKPTKQEKDNRSSAPAAALRHADDRHGPASLRNPSGGVAGRGQQSEVRDQGRRARPALALTRITAIRRGGDGLSRARPSAPRSGRSPLRGQALCGTINRAGSQHSAHQNVNPGRPVCVKRLKLNRLKHLALRCAHHAVTPHCRAGVSGVDIQQLPATLPSLLLSCCSPFQDHQCTELPGCSHHRQEAMAKNLRRKSKIDGRREQILPSARTKCRARKPDSRAQCA